MEMKAEMGFIFLSIARIFVYNHLWNFKRCSTDVQRSIHHIQTHTRITAQNITQTNFFSFDFFLQYFFFRDFLLLFLGPVPDVYGVDRQRGPLRVRNVRWK